jgi:hypothetical protein
MRTVLLGVVLLAAAAGAGFAQKASTAALPARIAVAFFDQERLGDPIGQKALKSFEASFREIQEIVKRDFPEVELRLLNPGETITLHDGTRIVAAAMQPELGYVLSSRGRKRKVLAGLQSDADFACAAAEFFQKASPACVK